MNDPLIVRLRIFQAYSQHSTQLLVHSQHGAQTCVRHKPRPEKYFGKKNFFIKIFPQQAIILFPTAIFTLSFKISPCDWIFQSTWRPTSEHELSKISTHFFSGTTLPISFFRIPEILHLQSFSPLHTLKIFLRTLRFFFSQNT